MFNCSEAEKISKSDLLSKFRDLLADKLNNDKYLKKSEINQRFDAFLVKNFKAKFKITKLIDFNLELMIKGIMDNLSLILSR